jgi:hypothetical protein
VNQIQLELLWIHQQFRMTRPVSWRQGLEIIGTICQGPPDDRAALLKTMIWC